MKNIIISADGDGLVYSVSDDIADNLGPIVINDPTMPDNYKNCVNLNFRNHIN